MSGSGCRFPACDNDFVIRIFGLSVVVSVAAVIAAYFYGGTSPLGAAQAVLLVLILGVLEISLSFDNAVINASILRRMSLFWQRMFLTVGIVLGSFAGKFSNHTSNADPSTNEAFGVSRFIYVAPYGRPHKPGEAIAHRNPKCRT
mgnify:CR=1 FL=1